MRENRRKTKIAKDTFQGKLIVLIFASAVIPVLIVAACLYYLIFNLMAKQMGIPEIVAYNLIPVIQKVNVIILVALPVTLLIILFFAVELSHRIFGPFSRLERELEERISGRESGPIKIRKKDELKNLVDKINRLLEKR